METGILNNGVEMPIPGFGGYRVTNPDGCEQSVLTALETGYRLIGTAAPYQNGEAIGGTGNGSSR